MKYSLNPYARQRSIGGLIDYCEDELKCTTPSSRNAVAKEILLCFVRNANFSDEIIALEHEKIFDHAFSIVASRYEVQEDILKFEWLACITVGLRTSLEADEISSDLLTALRHVLYILEPSIELVSAIVNDSHFPIPVTPELLEQWK